MKSHARVQLAILAVLYSTLANSDPQLNQGMKEYSSPGSTAVGRSIEVLAPWGPPTKISPLGRATIYYWYFPNPGTEAPTSYSGTVDRQGNIQMSGYKPPPQGCEVTVTVDEDGTIRSAKSNRINAWYCTIPQWYKTAEAIDSPRPSASDAYRRCTPQAIRMGECD